MASFVFDGVLLIKDIGGSYTSKWCQNFIYLVFTEEELRNGVLEPTKRSERKHLAPIRVKFVKRFSNLKYCLFND